MFLILIARPGNNCIASGGDLGDRSKFLEEFSWKKYYVGCSTRQVLKAVYGRTIVFGSGNMIRFVVTPHKSSKGLVGDEDVGMEGLSQPSKGIHQRTIFRHLIRWQRIITWKRVNRETHTKRGAWSMIMFNIYLKSIKEISNIPLGCLGEMKIKHTTFITIPPKVDT